MINQCVNCTLMITVIFNDGYGVTWRAFYYFKMGWVGSKPENPKNGFGHPRVIFKE